MLVLILCKFEVKVNQLLYNSHLILLLLIVYGIKDARENKSCVAVAIWVIDI